MCSQRLGSSPSHEINIIYWSYGLHRWASRYHLVHLIFRSLFGWNNCFLFSFGCLLQYINPIVQNSQHPLKGNFLYAIERVLKLSVPNLYVWLCMFYCFFHLWCVCSSWYSENFIYFSILFYLATSMCVRFINFKKMPKWFVMNSAQFVYCSSQCYLGYMFD